MNKQREIVWNGMKNLYGLSCLGGNTNSKFRLAFQIYKLKTDRKVKIFSK